MTQFIESISTHQLLPPYHSVNSQVHGFLFGIDAKAIGDFCDQFLNLGNPLERGFIYKPVYAAPFGLLTLNRYPRICSLVPRVTSADGAPAGEDGGPAGGVGEPDGEWDHLQQNEFFCAVPVYRYSLTSDNIMFDPVVRWVQPFIVVDNATSAFSAREILGLDMLYGHIDTVTNDATGDMTVDVSLPSWEEFRPDCAQKMAPFIEVKMGPPLGDDGSSNGEAAAEAKALLASGALAQIEAAMPDLSHTALRGLPEVIDLVILKQFRAAGDPYTAIYQALVGTQWKYSDISELTLYKASGVTVQFMGGAMVNEIIRTFLNLKPSTPDTLPLQPLLTPQAAFGAPPLPPQPTFAKIEMAFSFKATIDVAKIRTLYTFHDGTRVRV